jgi:hypothetical protein
MTKSEAESLPKPYPTATSPEKLQTTTITTRESTEFQELVGTLANTSHRSRPRGRGGGGAEEGLDPNPQKRREGKGRGRPQIQIPPHLPRRSRAVLSISRCMEVMRAREKGYRRKGVAPLTGCYHRHALLRWLRGRVGRSEEGGRKGGRSGSPLARQEVRTHGGSSGAAARREKSVGRKRMSG